MAYITGSVTDANPGPALYALMAPALTTAGFTLVDTVTISTRTHKVWKSAAASNAHNLDWYLDIGYTTTGAGTLALVPFEFYDPATDVGYRGAYSGSSSTIIDATTSSRYGATGSALETNWLSAAATFTAYPLTLGTGTFGYWFSATTDRAILLTSNNVANVMYAGFYQPDSLYAGKAGAALYPLIAVNASGGAMANSNATPASVAAAVTRVPPATTLAGNGWGNTVTVMASTMQAEYWSYPQIPSGSTALYPFVALPVEIVSAGPNVSAGVSTRFGVLRDVVLIPSGAVARGDTVTISGASHVLASVGTNNLALAFKAA